MIDTSLTLDYLGNPMPQSPNPTNGVVGTTPGQTLYGKKGVSNWIMSDGGGSILIGGGSGDTFYVADPTDQVIATANSGVNTVVSWTTQYTLPANVQNLILQTDNVSYGTGNNLNNLLVAQGNSTYTLVAGTGNDVFIGNGSGYSGDTGGSTIFVIAAGDGDDVISNFVNSADLVRLENYTNLGSFAAVRAAMTQVGANVVLKLNGVETLTFDNETISSFTAADFALSADLPNMVLRFDDEFNTFTSSPLGTQGWMTQGGSVWRTLSSNHEAEYYSDSSVGVNPFSDQNGILTITAAPGTNPLGLPYNSGIITTETSLNFEYGLVQVSAKLPAGNGLWPAIWMGPSNFSWPPELDIMEMLGNDPSVIYVGTHSTPANIATTTAVYVGDTTQAFHTYGVDWEPNTITWYFDGNAIFSEATPSDMHQPMYLIINLAVGGVGSWPGPPTSAAEFPAEMSISSVQYYASAASTAITGALALAPSAPVTILGTTAVSGSTGPSITGVTASPAGGDLTVGATISITLTFSAAVTVAGGVPTLALNDGGTATYVTGSASSALVFSYVVAAGQNTAALAPASGNAVILNGATIADSSGNTAVLTGANGAAFGGTLQIDTTPPTVTAVAASLVYGDLRIGYVVTFTVTFSEAVSVAGGAPSLALDDGGTATYVSGSGSTALLFSYTVLAGQNTTSLGAAASDAIALNGATIRDAAGNAAVLTGANGYKPPGTLQVDTVTPAITAITLSPANGDLSIGSTVTLTVTFSEVVRVAGGVPTLALNDGGTATYVSGSATTALVFSYVVAAGQNAADLALASSSAFLLNGASIRDGAGNYASVTSANGFAPAGVLQIDTTAPTVVSVATLPGSGIVGIGNTVALTLTFSEAVFVAGGVPTLALNDGGTATYVSGSGGTALVFSYLVAAGQSTTDLALAASGAVVLNGASIRDGAGNAAVLTGADGFAPSGILQVETSTPIITGITASPSSGDLTIGGTVVFTVTFGDAVTVAGGVPGLVLNDGGTASYVSGSGSVALVFSYVVTAGQNTADLALAASNAVSLNGATIRDASGANAVLTAANGFAPSGVLQVDTTAPSATAVTAIPGSGDLTVGSTIALTVAFSEAVVVAGGIPTLALNDGGNASYVSGSGTNALVFSYVVAAGQNVADLAIAASSPVALNGATIRDNAGNTAILTSLAGYAPAGTLQIDTTSPGVASVTTSPGSGTVATGGSVSMTLTFSEAVTVAGGVPTLALNDGGTATYTAGSGSNALVFVYVVAAGQTSADLALAASNAVALNGATIRDGAGNTAVLTGANGLNPAGTLQISGGAPKALAVSGWYGVYSPGSGTYNVTGTAGGAQITLGNGNQTVNVTGTNNVLETGSGNETVTFTGNNNTVVTGAGTSVITMIGAYESVTVGATPTGTTTINAAGFDELITSTGTGNVVVTGPDANSTVSLGNGNDTVTLTGSGNTVIVGTGTSTISAGIGQDIVHAGGGADTITASGWNNLLDAGAGMNFLNGGSGNDTFELNGSGQGLDTLTGFALANNDVLDLTRTLSGVVGVSLSNVGLYITATTSGANTTLYVDPTGGHGTPYAFALLTDVTATVAQLVSYNDFKVP